MQDSDEFARVIGHCSLAWTACHSNVFLIFKLTSGFTDEAARRIFFKIRQDYLQRELAISSLESCDWIDGERKQEIIEVVEKLGYVSNRRNVAVHQMWSRDENDNIIPHPDAENFLKDKYSQNNSLRDLFGKLHEELHNIYHQLMDHCEYIENL
ncbi:hypothetical protein [Polymorphum gilvum]|uniref:hypothetical protein n=1 Tax=Polymorphum gilvum TaxID=991904 RepID=UPI0011D1A582|nr:hypothetical protein [Polymorphum gilvum]